jgi:hypothetical protein
MNSLQCYEQDVCEDSSLGWEVRQFKRRKLMVVSYTARQFAGECFNSLSQLVPPIFEFYCETPISRNILIVGSNFSGKEVVFDRLTGSNQVWSQYVEERKRIEVVYGEGTFLVNVCVLGAEFTYLDAARLSSLDLVIYSFCYQSTDSMKRASQWIDVVNESSGHHEVCLVAHGEAEDGAARCRARMLEKKVGTECIPIKSVIPGRILSKVVIAKDLRTRKYSSEKPRVDKEEKKKKKKKSKKSKKNNKNKKNKKANKNKNKNKQGIEC